MIDGLPPESLVKTAIQDTLSAEDFKEAPESDSWGAWSSTDRMLALLADRMSWLVYAIYHVQGGTPEAPEPIRRPGIGLPPADRRALRRTQRISAAHLAYLLDHNGASPPPGWDPGIDD